MRTLRFVPATTLAAALLGGGCATVPAPGPPSVTGVPEAGAVGPPPPLERAPRQQAERPASGWPHPSPEAPEDELAKALDVLVEAFYAVRGDELRGLIAVFDALAAHPALVDQLAERYRRLPQRDLERRLMLVSLLGEIQRPDALAIFADILSAPLPERSSLVEGMSPRDVEEMIQAKAAHGVAYLRSAEADELLFETLRSHPAMLVRVEAVNAYMWNHEDHPDAAERLYRLLPPELHPWIEMPRFHRGVDREDFNRRVEEWRKKWPDRTEG